MRSLALVVLLVVFQQPTKSPKSSGAAKSVVSQSAQQTETSNHNNDDAKAPTPNTVNVFVEQPSPQEPQRDTPVSDDYVKTQREIGTFTGFLVLVGFIQAGIIFLQLLTYRRQAKFFERSERAWVMAELSAFEKESTLFIAVTTEQDGTEFTTVNLKLTCRNEGRTPAWIEDIRGRIDIVNGQTVSQDPRGRKLNSLNRFPPIGASKEKWGSVQFMCSGRKEKPEDFFSVYLVIDYRDIFGRKRETSLGYSVMEGRQVIPQGAFPERNQNT